MHRLSLSLNRHTRCVVCMCWPLRRREPYYAVQLEDSAERVSRIAPTADGRLQWRLACTSTHPMALASDDSHTDRFGGIRRTLGWSAHDPKMCAEGGTQRAAFSRTKFLREKPSSVASPRSLLQVRRPPARPTPRRRAGHWAEWQTRAPAQAAPIRAAQPTVPIQHGAAL